MSGVSQPTSHVATADGECKFWLEPIGLANNKGLRADLVRHIERLVYDYAEFLKEKYYEYHQP